MIGPAIFPDLIEQLATLAGLAVPNEDLDLLQAVLANHIASSRALLSLDLEDTEPIVSFDPRWR